MHNLGESIKNKLDAKLNRYCDEVQGILLSYEKVEINPKNPCGVIMEDMPFLIFDILATVRVLQIKRGFYMRGNVTKISDNGLALLVENGSSELNASILPSHIDKDLFHYNWQKNIWERKKSKGNAISFDIHEGDDIDFAVLSLDEAGARLHVHGSLGPNSEKFSSVSHDQNKDSSTALSLSDIYNSASHNDDIEESKFQPLRGNSKLNINKVHQPLSV